MNLDRRYGVAALAISILLAAGTTRTVQAAIPASERAVLLGLYTSTNGAGWTTSTNWNGAAGTECTWYGITCGLGETTVTSVDLSFNRLAGTLPADLNNLTNLQGFQAQFNDLTGSIPALTGLTNLQIFRLQYNYQLTGSIPTLAGLTNLQNFDVEQNQLTGSIPALAGLANLQSFNVGLNQLTGSIPALASLTNLQIIYVNGNQLTGSIPALAGLSNLQRFAVDNNQLTGSIPALTGLPTLFYFYVNVNQLTGPIPALTDLTSLEQFSTEGNQLTGTIPTLTGLTNLQFFDVQSNQLTGAIPALTGLTNLTFFTVQDNQLTGSIPALTGLTNLQLFYVTNNQLTGSIPTLTGLTNMVQLSASGNQLTGSIPALAGLTSLQFFGVGDNQLTGSIPALAGLTSLEIFYVQTNQLTGSIPALTGLTNLQKFVVNNNLLTGNIPSVPVSSALSAGGSALCPNLLNPTPDPAWDAATGQTPWFTNCAAPPGPPTAVTATPGNASATVTFTPPVDNGGSPVTGYTATCGGQSANGAASPIVVAGLINGTAYNCTVTATNAAGPGTASAPSNSVTPATVPGAPTGANATAGNAQASASFTPPASNGGSAITSYTATSSPGGLTGNCVAPCTQIVVGGLTNGTSYTFTVKATNAIGPGAASAASNSVTPVAAASAPGAPTIGAASPGNTQATIRFSAPVSNGGSAITSYTATSSPGGFTANCIAPCSQIVVSGLTNGTSYTFTVKATNAIGTGAASAASNSVTPANVPGAPTALAATAGNTKASVTFSAPASNGGSAITGYSVTSSPAGGVDSNAGSTTTSHLVTGLTNGIAYTFTVKATNAVGNGPASSPSNAVTPSAGATTTGVSASPVTFVYQSNPVTFVATVNGVAPTGSVSFTNAGAAIGCNAMPLNGGSVNAPTAVCSLTLPLGSYSIIASYTGNASNAASSSSALPYEVRAKGVSQPPSAQVTVVGSQTATVSFVPPIDTGGSAITGYTVTATPTGGLNGVLADIRASVLPGVDLDAGSLATIHRINGLTNGVAYVFSVIATNASGPSAPSAPSEGRVPMPVADTSITLGSSANPSLPAQSVTFTATVTGSALSGSVSVLEGTTPLTGCAAAALVGSQAQCSDDTLAPGKHRLIAVYWGDALNAGSISQLAQSVGVPVLNVDASSAVTRYDALTDGLLIIRYLFGLTGSALTNGVLGGTATRTNATAVLDYLDANRSLLDIDGNGSADALTDGLLIVRYLFGLRGNSLIAGALDSGATRVTATDIEAYLQTLLP